MVEHAVDGGRAAEAVARVEDAVIEAPADELSLPFWVTATAEDIALGAQDNDTMGLFSRDGDAVLRSVPLGPFRKSLADTVDALQRIFQEVSDRGGPLPLAEAQLSFQVTASGGVQLIGTGQMQGTRGLTLTFKRPA
ncbi:Pepco domain-containing protein [Streptomyces sp. NPDC002845]